MSSKLFLKQLYQTSVTSLFSASNPRQNLAPGVVGVSPPRDEVIAVDCCSRISTVSYRCHTRHGSSTQIKEEGRGRKQLTIPSTNPPNTRERAASVKNSPVVEDYHCPLLALVHQSPTPLSPLSRFRREKEKRRKRGRTHSKASQAPTAPTTRSSSSSKSHPTSSPPRTTPGV